ncbi:DUF302 domain-containing protein [Thalassovita sp.]|uniref:DUF302 domain-containing protein n=1 Tax=Thalassovita sp. TaxID=1979401 RepID=UPI0029DE77A8|nr:DUF302 domain-containing protein [Thalassovita sp.]
MKALVIAAGLVLAASAGLADQLVSYSTDESYEDVVFGLENAIVDQGLVIDAVSHVGDMLERTRADVGSDVTIFAKAEVFSFCSANLSRKVMEADPMNLRFCPYGIFVAQLPDNPGQTIIGYRSMPEGPMKEVETLLDTITRSAIGME